MKKNFLIVLIIACTSSLFAQEIDRINLRTTFQACNSKERTENFHSDLQSNKSSKAITIGYLGAVTAMRAKFNLNPFKKYNYCREGLNLLNTAILQTPNDIELRYLRLIVESSIPSFLGMNCNVESDKKLIIHLLVSEKDLPLKNLITAFLLNSDLCTDKERKLLALG